MERRTDRVNLTRAVIGCVLAQLCVGILYLWSVFKTPVAEYYRWDANGAIIMISSVMLMCFVSGNLIGGFLQDRINPRFVAAIGAALFSLGIFFTSLLSAKTAWLIFFTYCVMGGLGSGFTYASVLSCLQKWFPKKRGFASGIAVASFSLSTVIFAPVSQWLLGISSFGDKAVPRTFLALSIVFFAISMLACLLIKLPLPADQNINVAPLATSSASPQITKESIAPRDAIKKLSFWCIALTCFFINGTWNIVVPLIKDLGIERGLAEALAVSAVTVTGITNTLGRFSMATVSDRIGRSFTMILLAVGTFVCAILMIFVTGYFFLVIIALLAFCYGGPASTLPAMTTDLCGPRYSGSNYGIVMMGLGLSSIIFNLLSMWIDNQKIGFIMGACTCVVSAALMLLYMRITKKKTKDAEVQSCKG